MKIISYIDNFRTSYNGPFELAEHDAIQFTVVAI